MKLHEIIPGKLYQRGRLPSNWSATKRDIKLYEAGIMHVVGLAPRADLVAEARVHYYHYPIPDGALSTRNQDLIRSVADMVYRWVAEDTPVLVHCNAGRNRSSLVTALVAGRYLGLSGVDAVQYVRDRRPNALANAFFVQFIWDELGIDDDGTS